MNQLENIEVSDLSEDIEMVAESENGAQQPDEIFANNTNCWVCNGYYGPNFGEPLCGTCHAFLHNTQNEEIVTRVNNDSDDEDSGNDEPPFKDKQEADDEDDNDVVDDDDVGVGDEDVDDNAQLERQQQINDAANNDNLAPPDLILDGEQQNLEERVDERFNRRLSIQRPRPSAPLSLPRYIELLCDATANAQESLPNNIERNGILALPVEIMVIIFSYLDDMSMWRSSTVCKRWNNIIAQNTSQQMWKKYFKERWPLYQSIVEVPNWTKLYGALMSSCFCHTCLIEMALKTPIRPIQNSMRTKSLRAEISFLNSIASEGIEAIPLDKQNTNWQASILGPAGSPYEGGKFFLFIFLPDAFPMAPPTVRFLTKILHPNVSRHGDVGIDIFQHNWSSALNVSKVLISVQSILTDPYTEVCMEPELGYMYEHNRSKFENLARAWTWKYAMFELMPPR